MRHRKGLLAIIAAGVMCWLILVLASMVHAAEVASIYPNAGPRACPGHYPGHTVAHKTLPCGTRVRFTLGSHTIVAVVNDRGPYKRGRAWDFPERSAHALGFNDDIGLVRVNAEIVR